MSKVANKVSVVKEEIIFSSKKLEQLENMREMLLSIACTMSDLIDEITDYGKQSQKRK